MYTNPNFRRILLIGAVALVAFVLVLNASGSQSPAAAQQALSCSWNRFGQSSRAHYHHASAMNAISNTLYFYGGLNETGDVMADLGQIDLTNPNINQAQIRALNPGGRLERYGSAGAFRSAGAQSAAYFIGGADSSGDGKGDVQVFNAATGTWSRPSAGGVFSDRLWAGAAWDPTHDVIWVAGGIGTCALTPGPGCRASNIDTNYMSFDPMTGAPTWNRGPTGGPNNVYGHTMVYDSVGNRILAFGGTNDGTRTNRTVFALNLSDPNPANARWSMISTGSGGPQGLAFHGAAFDAPNNRMVLYGGVTQNFFGGTESRNTRTFALNMGTNPPSWSDLNASTGERVGPIMQYDANHSVVVMHGGRSGFSSSGNQSVSRSADYLGCQAPPTPAPTNTPGPTRTPGGVEPTNTPPIPPTVPAVPEVCESIRGRVPPEVINDALANPDRISGHQQLCNPNLPASPFNTVRRFLSLRNPNAPFHPLFNNLVWRCGCR